MTLVAQSCRGWLATISTPHPKSAPVVAPKKRNPERCESGRPYAVVQVIEQSWLRRWLKSRPILQKLLCSYFMCVLLFFPCFSSVFFWGGGFTHTRLLFYFCHKIILFICMHYYFYNILFKHIFHILYTAYTCTMQGCARLHCRN